MGASVSDLDSDEQSHNTSKVRVPLTSSPSSCVKRSRNSTDECDDSDSSTNSNYNDDAFGWFEDFEGPTFTDEFQYDGFSSLASVKGLTRAYTLPTPLTCPPVYVLEASLSSQQLWYQTAGRRPRQPAEEREHFEKLWGENFAASHVSYIINDHGEHDRRSRVLLTVLFKGIGVASTAVSKSFNNTKFSSITIQLPRFRIVRTASGIIHAEYLVVVVLNTVSLGIWRRHSEFKTLWNKVQNVCAKEEVHHGRHQFKNSLSSWQCLIHRQRWFRCLDKDYLGLKCFLLERFMHDLLFESNTPDMIAEFLGLLD
eukprot:gene2403-4663_t